MIVALVDIAVARACLPQFVDAGCVAWIGAGADEVVERCLQRLGQRAKTGRVARDQLRHRDTLAFGALDIGERVLVAASEKEDILADPTMVAGQRVRQHVFQCVADVRIRVHIRNGSRNIPA